MVPRTRDFELVIGTQFGPYTYAFNATKSRTVGTFTVNPSTDVCTLVAHGMVNGDQVRFTTTDVLPDPLLDNNYYYLVSVTTDTFKLSLTSGGAAIDIEDIGTGTHTLIERGTPFDLTGWTFYSWVKGDLEDDDSTLLLDLAPMILTPSTNGLVQILLAQTVSYGLSQADGFHSLVGKSPANVRLAFTRGKFSIVKVSTHPAP